jgi:hypothetical protein|tara:strand:- start:768 stop:1871 length:1104 start_codon:yes stop_codon:yes gene_type:complete
MSNDLLKEAIADAKAVRETALANAKIALEEAFTPKLQSMISAKIQNEAEEMEEEELEESDTTVETYDEDMEENMYEDEDMDEDEEMPMNTPAEEDEEMSMDAAEPEMDAAVEDMDTDETYEGEDMDTDETYEGEEMEEDLELEAIIRELEEELEEDEDMDEVSEDTDSSDIGSMDNKVDTADSSDTEDPAKVSSPDDLTEEDDMDETEELEEEVDLEEIIRSLQEEDEVDETEDTEEAVHENETLKSNLEEAYNVVRFLKGKINEVNLLNGKLLFTNKLFKAYSLSEGQKLKVIETFDRAKNIREVKLVYSTLAESMNSTIASTRNVRTIKEGMASKSTASTKPSKTILTEGDEMANRFKKLAGLIN